MYEIERSVHPRRSVWPFSYLRRGRGVSGGSIVVAAAEE